MKQNDCKAYRFFASANGTAGFRSYFDEIFPSESLTGVFILKGGPGTGKSTLMKRLSSHFECPEIGQEIFHCSSDPRSLDGLLLTKGERRVAILDGTAPHERDARIPGATDILVNLGEGFDRARLREERARILTLQRKKSIFYKDAYFYLGLYGIFASKIMAETESRLKKTAVFAWSEEPIFKKLEKDGGPFSPRLIGSFSKEGLSYLPTFLDAAEEKYCLLGDEAERLILLSSLFSLLKSRGIQGIYSPSPLFAQITDGLLLGDRALCISVHKAEGASIIETSDYFEKSAEEAMQRTAEYKTEALRYLSLAKEALVKASECHFSLESIYTPCMDFSHIDRMTKALKGEIASLLCHREIS